MMSFPPPPLIVSLPLPPQITSSPGVPFNTSEWLVPVIVQTSPAMLTRVVAVAESLDGLESTGEEDATAVFEIVVPSGVAWFTFTTRVDAALVPDSSEGLRQLTLPVPPREGLVQVQPAGAIRKTNVEL